MEEERGSKAESNQSTRHREFDDVYDHVRSFGRLQQIMFYATTFGLVYPMSGQFSALVFAMGTPNFECATPNVTCPPKQCCENCTDYVFTGPMRTTVSEWNLICDRAYQAATLQSCYFAGMFIGSITSGIVSDRFGRKMCMFGNFVIMFLASVASSFVDCISFFGFLRFLTAYGLTGTMLSLYTYMIELVGPKRRTMAGSVPGAAWNGYGALGVVLAYFVPQWRYLLLVYTVPAILLFPTWRWFPESPRWLVAQGRCDEAHKILMKYGPKKGHKAIDSEALRALLGEIRQTQVEKERHDSKKYTPVDLVRTPKLRRWILQMGYQWFTVAVVNFGVFLFATQLAGNIYVNYIVMWTIATLRVPVNWFVYAKFGRRLCILVLWLMAGTLCLLILGFYKDYPSVTAALSITGGVISSNWSGIYLMTVELFPTVLRNTALGTGSMVARAGAIIAPYIAMTGQLPGLSMALPVTIFGTLAVVAGISTYWIPETVFAQMHQTIEEAEAAKDDYALPCCRKPLATEVEEVTPEGTTREPLLQTGESTNATEVVLDVEKAEKA